MSGRRIVQAVAGAFLASGGCGAALILAWGPAWTPARVIGFLASDLAIACTVAMLVYLWLFIPDEEQPYFEESDELLTTPEQVESLRERLQALVSADGEAENGAGS